MPDLFLYRSGLSNIWMEWSAVAMEHIVYTVMEGEEGRNLPKNNSNDLSMKIFYKPDWNFCNQ